MIARSIARSLDLSDRSTFFDRSIHVLCMYYGHSTPAPCNPYEHDYIGARPSDRPTARARPHVRPTVRPSVRSEKTTDQREWTKQIPPRRSQKWIVDEKHILLILEGIRFPKSGILMSRNELTRLRGFIIIRLGGIPFPWHYQGITGVLLTLTTDYTNLQFDSVWTWFFLLLISGQVIFVHSILLEETRFDLNNICYSVEHLFGGWRVTAYIVEQEKSAPVNPISLKLDTRKSQITKVLHP